MREFPVSVRDESYSGLLRSLSRRGGDGSGPQKHITHPGANHGFMTGKPNAPYAGPAIERMKAFIRAHTG